MPDLVTARNLTVIYPKRSEPALRDASIRLEAGRVHVLLGRNGAGKSTLMHALLGLLPPTSGTVEPASGTRLGWCAQRLVIDWFLGVWDNVLLGARLRGLAGPAAREAAQDALDAVGLGEKAKLGPEELSGGEQQRLMVARTLAYAPDVYVLDEPFVGLDAVVREGLMGLLRERARAGAAILVSSHELSVLERDVHDVTLIDAGRVVFDGGCEGFLERFVPLDTVTVTLRRPCDKGELRLLGVPARRVGESSFELRVRRGAPIGELLSRAAALGELLDVARDSPTLDDAVRAAYGDGAAPQRFGSDRP